ncbi:E3 ubiquitin-protein ligase TRIM7-like isoform X1 [Anomaloglossus baeobatrachus]|uniref:E3 ubiquitin-protein ligase TRIM7-like isoform X1 n=1 Tax=Anomaloglossus baeobatrachus TaxID=238106 RepID=UPI003F50A129
MAEACSPSDQEETGIFCTFCDFSVPAEKSCLQCETSMCATHVTRHNKTALGHTLLPPSTDLKNRKCPVHQKILEYYCKEDEACICVSCWVEEDHMSHRVQPVKEAVDHKKKTLMSRREKLRSMEEDSEKKKQSLQENSRRAHEKSEAVSKRVNAQFQTISKDLEILQTRLLSEIRRQEKMVAQSNTRLIQQLDKKKDELSKRIREIDELMGMDHPLMVLQELEEDDNHWEEDAELEEARCDGGLREDIDLNSMLESISDLVTSVENGIYMYEPTKITLDEGTVCDNAAISCDSHGSKAPDKVAYSTVLSMENFSFGKYYWAVRTCESGAWRVGVSDANISRTGHETLIGDNDKSWCLHRSGNKIYARHDSEDVAVPHTASYDRLLVAQLLGPFIVSQTNSKSSVT